MINIHLEFTWSKDMAIQESLSLKDARVRREFVRQTFEEGLCILRFFLFHTCLQLEMIRVLIKFYCPGWAFIIIHLTKVWMDLAAWIRVLHKICKKNFRTTNLWQVEKTIETVQKVNTFFLTKRSSFY